MTYIYQWFQFPETFSVTCKNCGKESQCSEISSRKKTDGIFKSRVTCISCGFNSETNINWPEDAFWKFSIHGKILWAWSAAHAKAIADYIDSKHRDEFQSEFSASLFHIPEYFKLAKHRELIVKKISKKLQENT